MDSTTKKMSFEDAFGIYTSIIKESLTGLEEIFKINFLENNIYHSLARENIEAINVNVLELLKGLYSPRQVRQKLRELKYDELEATEEYLDI